MSGQRYDLFSICVSYYFLCGQTREMPQWPFLELSCPRRSSQHPKIPFGYVWYQRPRDADCSKPVMLGRRVSQKWLNPVSCSHRCQGYLARTVDMKIKVSSAENLELSQVFSLGLRDKRRKKIPRLTDHRKPEHHPDKALILCKVGQREKREKQ